MNIDIDRVSRLFCADELEIETDEQGIIKINPVNYAELHGFKRTALALDKYSKMGKVKMTPCSWSDPKISKSK